MTLVDLIRKRQLTDREALLKRRSSGGAGLRFTWLNFQQGQNQQDSNGVNMNNQIITQAGAYIVSQSGFNLITQQ